MRGIVFNEIWLKRLCAAGAALFILSLVVVDAAKNYKPAKEWQTTLGNEPVAMSPDGVLYFLGKASSSETGGENSNAPNGARKSPSIPSYAIATYSGLILIDPMIDHLLLTQTLANFNLTSNAIRAIVLMNDDPARRAAAQALADRTGAKVFALVARDEHDPQHDSQHDSQHGGDRSDSAFEPLSDGGMIHVGDTRLYVVASPAGASPKVCLLARVLKRNVLFTGNALGELQANEGRSQSALARRISATPVDLMLPSTPWHGGEYDAELAARQWRTRTPHFTDGAFDPRSELGSRGSKVN